MGDGADDRELAERERAEGEGGVLALDTHRHNGRAGPRGAQHLRQALRGPRDLEEHLRFERGVLDRDGQVGRAGVAGGEGAQSAREVQPVVVAVEHEDAGAGARGGEGDERADAPGPDDHRVLPRSEAAATHGVDGDRHGLGKAQRVGAQPAGADVEDDRRRGRDVPRQAPVEVEAERAVGAAEIGPPGPARAAVAARHSGAADDGGAGGEIRDRRTDRLDGADEFVPEHDRRLGEDLPAPEFRGIRPADPAHGDPDEHLVRARRGDRAVLHPEIADRMEDGGAHRPHVRVPAVRGSCTAERSATIGPR